MDKSWASWLWWWLWLVPTLGAVELGGFDLTNALVPVAEITPGGPPPDGIPALVRPGFLSVVQVDYLEEGDQVLAWGQGSQARAYPIKILNWHEVINDQAQNQRLLITYCPLCGSGMAFSPQVGGRELEFGVSGLLYQSDLLLFDRQTKSLWSQILGLAISGPLKGSKLEPQPLGRMEWNLWKAKNPKGMVLSLETGHLRNYQRDPYLGYGDLPQIYFPVSRQDDRYHPKEWVIGLVYKNQALAFPFAELAKSPQPDQQHWQGQRIQVWLSPDGQSARIIGEEGKDLVSLQAFWFAWINFYPSSQIYQAPAN